MNNIQVFLQTLPIIGTSLVGIFGVTLFMILIVHLLNYASNYGIGEGTDKK